MADKVFEKLLEVSTKVQKNILLGKYTTYKIGGPAKYFFDAKNTEELVKVLNVAKQLKLKIFVMGGGSNLLVSDKGFNGLVVRINLSGAELRGNKIYAGAGAKLVKVALLSAENNLSGLEWAVGIPGATVGGSIYGHAQAFGVKTSTVIESVEAIDLKTLKIKEFSKEQCKFSLKNSVFKRNKNLVIVSAVLVFEKKNKKEIENKIKEFLDYRKNRHPKQPSAGSTFVNPEIKIKNKKLLEKYPELKEFNNTGIIPAGYLIQKTGLQGKKIGNAQISNKHANFIVNLGGADAKCIVGLINLAKRKVKKTFGIDLVQEVQMVGF